MTTAEPQRHGLLLQGRSGLGHPLARLPLLFNLLALATLGLSRAAEKSPDTLYNEAYRPAFHFTPPSGWLNDPTGLVYYKDIYHLYYQYVPLALYGQKGAGKHWGHATSEDLIHWKHEPIAIGMDPTYGGAPSGSTAIDWQNRSGLQRGGDPVFCAYFAQRNAATGQSCLMMAYSTNGGTSFSRYAPLAQLTPPGKKRYDPDVFWHASTKRWIMVASEHLSRFIFLESTDLKQWKEFHTLDLGDVYQEMWDCPDVYPLAVAEEPSVTKWIISFSLFTKTEGQNTSQAYFVGDFDGKKFSVDTRRYQFLDQGPDMHAGTTWSEMPDNSRRIFIAWFGNWRGRGNKIPTKPWWGALTLPREVTLHKTRDGYRLYSQPVKESLRLREGKVSSLTSLPSQFEMQYTCDRSHDSRTTLSNARGEKVVFGYTAASSTFYFDRAQAGEFDRSVRFPKRHSFKIESRSDALRIRVLVDHSMAELFINDGEYSMSEQFFPEQPFQSMQIEPLPGDLQIWKLQNVWHH